MRFARRHMFLTFVQCGCAPEICMLAAAVGVFLAALQRQHNLTDGACAGCRLEVAMLSQRFIMLYSLNHFANKFAGFENNL
jgi:hypothetical protein